MSIDEIDNISDEFDPEAQENLGLGAKTFVEEKPEFDPTSDEALSPGARVHVAAEGFPKDDSVKLKKPPNMPIRKQGSGPIIGIG